MFLFVVHCCYNYFGVNVLIASTLAFGDVRRLYNPALGMS